MSAFSVMYHPDEPYAQVSTPEELDALLDQVVLRARYDAVPTYVEMLSPGEHRGLHIALGHSEHSTLTFYDVPSDTVSASVGGPIAQPGTFDYDGTPTRAPRDSAIPESTARAAAREFLETELRPTNLGWQTPDYGPA